MSNKSIRRCSCILLLSQLLCSNVALGLDRSPQDILRQTLETEANLPPLMMDIEVSQYYAVDYAAGRNSGTKQKICFFKDGDSFDVSKSLYVREAYDEGGPFKRVSDDRTIWDGNRTVMKKSVDAYGTSGYLRKDKMAMTWLVRAPYLHGVLNYGSSHFADELLKSQNLKINDGIEVIDDFPCYVIEGNAGNKSYTVWIDTQNGSLCRRAVVKEDLKPPVRIAETGKTLISRTFETSGIKIEQIEDHFVITESRQVVQNAYADGTSDQDRHEAKRVGVRWNPDFESLGAFKMDMPNGTYVKDLDYGIKYVWQDGKLRAALDQDALDGIEDAVFQLKAEGGPLASRPPKNEIARKESVTREQGEPNRPKARKVPLAGSGKTTYWTLIITILVLGVVGILAYGLIQRRKGHVNE